ncbi:MAG: acyl-ACP--UDP-N-acetylglucosamine O-acyltransferase [Thermoplasmata archaeon]|nr:acyl-ACP--UDP-N-acetylglucosamine O-acyltransferase [Thermoplasmata archaeon]
MIPPPPKEPEESTTPRHLSPISNTSETIAATDQIKQALDRLEKTKTIKEDNLGSTIIHPTAIVHPDAAIAHGVTIGPHAVIGRNVTIGDGTKIYPNVVIDGNTTIGRFCEIFPGASIGLKCQDLKYKGERTYVIIGDQTVIRECATVNSSTGDEGKTIVGKRCFLMAYSHVAHNSTLGDEVIMANSATLAGHIVIEDKAILSGLVAVHQYVRIGTLSITGGLSKVNQDVPPYSLSDGNPCSVRDINVIGLRRHGFDLETRSIIRRAFKILFKSGLNTRHALQRVRDEIPRIPQIIHLIEFVENSKRGIGR